MAKAFTDRAQFEREKETLIKCEDEKGKQRIIQYKGEFEPGLTIYLEYAAGGSLKALLDDKPHGLPENEVKNWVKPPLHRYHLGCILLKMSAISLLTGRQGAGHPAVLARPPRPLALRLQGGEREIVILSCFVALSISLT